MKTVLDNLRTEGVRIQKLLEELEVKSSIRRWHNPNTDGFVFIGGNYAWSSLDSEGHQIQSRVLEEFRRFSATVHTLLRKLPQDALDKLDEADATVIELIQQQGTLFRDDRTAYFGDGTKALHQLVELLDRLYGQSEGRTLYVPDTNALIFNPVLEKWNFDGGDQFSIVFTPPVLSELDSLKINHRVEAVREKAEKVIRQLKEYRRRAELSGGRLADGVVIRKGLSEVFTLATEPRMEESLPWLDAQNKDDQILATVIEVMRIWPRSNVQLVTRDINLQNKADYANVPFVEPPDLV